MKINILGFAGSGKSSLAERLSQELSLPVLYLDTLCWLPGWKERSREEQRALLQAFLDKNPGQWVIDGNYSKNLFEERMASADLIIFLNYNRFRCLYRILKRRIMFSGKDRPSMTQGCKERITLAFLKAAFWDSRKPSSVAKFRKVQAAYPDKFHEIKTPRQLEVWLKKTFGLQ